MAAVVFRGVRVEMRPEGGKTVSGTGLPGVKGVDAAGSVIAAESSPHVVLIGRKSILGDGSLGSGGFCRALTAP